MSSRSPITLTIRALLVLLASAVIFSALSSGLIRPSFAEKPAPTQNNSQKVALSKSEVAARYGKLPLSFEPNLGQTDEQVRFLARGASYGLFLTSTGMVLTLQEPKPVTTQKGTAASSAADSSTVATQNVQVLRLTMIGANPKSSVEGQNELPGKINYLIGNDKSKWRTNIPTYLKVHYAEIYPKVDLVYYGNQSELEYDFIVAPGGKVQSIKFQIEGADRITLDRPGNLILHVNKRELRLSKPVIYQLTDKGDRRDVKGEYVVAGKEIGFKVESYDASKPLIIDPVLSYATLIGASGHELAYGVAVDQSGNAYITGNTTSNSFPTTAGAFQMGNGFLSGVFVTKLDATGSNLIYSTYLGGSGGSSSGIGTAIAVDTAGHAYVTGHTSSSDFPTQNPIRGGRYNLLKTSDAGAVWNKKSVGSINAPVIALAVDPTTPSTVYAGSSFGGGIQKSIDSGNTWSPLVTGVTNATCSALVIDPSTPTTIYAALTTTSFTGGVFKSTDSGATWASVSTGLSSTSVTALAMDPLSPSTLYAGTQSGMYKTTNGGGSWALSSTGLNFSGFTSIVIDPTLTSTIYAGLAGGGVFKTTNSAANWSQVNTGLTNTLVRTLSLDPTSPATLYAGTVGGGIFKSTNSGGNWSPINNGLPTNTAVISSTLAPASPSTIFIGTSNGQIFKTTDGGNNWTRVFDTLTSTRVNTLVMDPAAPATVYAGVDTTAQSLLDSEVFATKLNPDGSGLIYSTFIGGIGNDRGYGIAIDSTGASFIAGETASTNFPAINAIQANLGSCTDGFVTKLNAAGSDYVFSTYLGGNGCDIANAVATDAVGNAYATGGTSSTNFPIANAFQATKASGGDAFATKINSNGTLGYSTFLGGNDSDIGYGIAADSSGNAYITGQTSSSNYPTLNPIQTNPNSFLGDVFVTKLNNLGSGLIYSTYLAGSYIDVGRGIAVDSTGNAYVTGFTGSIDFPVIAGTLRTKSPFFQSSDGGTTWSNYNFGLKALNVSAITLHPTNPSLIFAGTGNGVYKSVDGGRNWTPSNTGLTNSNIIGLVIDPITPSTLYVGASSGSNPVHKSTDGGATWNAVSTGLGGSGITCLAIDPITPTTLYAGWGGGVFKTINGGTNWTNLGGLFSTSAIVVDPGTPTTIYAAGNSSGGGVFKSINGGTNWQSVNTGLTTTFILTLAIDPVTPSTLYAGANGGFFKSVDGGANWTSSGTGLPGASVVDIAINPVSPTTVYAAASGSGGGVFKSINGGNNWVRFSAGIGAEFVSSVSVDPLSPSKVYAGANSFSSDNDGFVAKINSAGNALIYSTYLGNIPAPGHPSNFNDEAFGIAIDSLGNAYVAGQSTATEFSVTSDSYQPFNRGFTDAFVAKLTMSHIVSGQVLDGGSVPVSGAEITLNDGVSLRAVFTESDGSYEFSQLPQGGNFTVSAAKPNFTMSPPSHTFNNLTSNQTANFVATPSAAAFYTISGQVTENSAGLGGVTVTLSGSQAGLRTTDSNGNYSFTLAGAGDYTVTPAKLGFSFTPTSLTFNNLSANQTADFTSTRQGFVVINAKNHGTGSLRQAILNANATPGADVITFNIPGSGVHTINLFIGLPGITDPVVLDATTQPGYAGTPLIELNGAQAGSGASGFSISAGASTIRGFAINRFNNAGIALSGNGNNLIEGNYIGLDPTGTLGRPNFAGILGFSSSNNTIGGTTPGARNVISANSFDGIEITGSANQIIGNFIGTNSSGTAPLPNGINGVELNNIGGPGSINNVIGGTNPGAGNLISGNQRGITNSAINTVIQGNLIGTDPTGTVAVGNGTGIDSSGINVLIGGTAPGARNLISGNAGGVRISGLQSRLQGNLIGTDITGTIALGNTGGGVFAGSHALIGGTTPAARNVISGNGGNGNLVIGFNILADFPVTVQGNYIGTDVTGNVALNNPSYGVAVSSSNNQIGGVVPGARNIVSGNFFGVQIGGFSGGASGNVVRGNFIGLNAAGNAPLPNVFEGVRVFGATGTTIGGVTLEASNTIAFNGGNGVWVGSQTGNSIRGNSIYSNGGLGIDLTPFNVANPDGVSQNDLNDPDTGANNLQNFPLLTSVSPNGGGTSIQGTFNSTPNTTFQIDFYSNVACDPSGYGEGALFFDNTSVMTDANGNATINFASAGILPSGRVLTATATDPTGNTSEFSPCDSSNAIGNLQFSIATYNVLEDVGAALITVVRHGGTEGALSVDYNTVDGTAIAGSDYTAVSGTFNFVDGETSKTFTIPIADDGVSEPNETVKLVLTGFTDLETRGNPTSATMVIQDSTTPLFLLLSSIDVVEGDSGTTNGSVLVSLSAQTGRTVTADIGYLPTSATANVDFVPPSGSVTFLPGVITQTITVAIIGDTLTEFNETFRVQLSNAVNAGVANFSLVRIIDQDPLRIDGGTKAGRVSGGQTIQLTGAFARLSTVKMGGTSATWFFGANSGIINVITPAHAAGAVQIDMTQTGGSPYSKPIAFAYLQTVFTDNTLVVGQTTAKAQHIIELRQAIDSLRAVAGLAPASWTDPTVSPASTIIKVVHIVELRTYLDDVATQLGYATSPYTDPSLGAGSVIKRIHLEELRQRIRTIAG